ncbi:MAG: GPR1/FUN34/YaaH family transporter [Desulfotomaculaceae bacterium]|nr:GPR1/FUN34/YaaH family transporter [Desulfotomaculaceae bacterium]
MSEKQAWAPGSPAGFMCMAFYLAVLCPMLIGISGPQYGILLVPFGFIGMAVQLIVGTVELKRGDVVSGNITLAFSAFMAFGAILTLLKFMDIAPQDTAFGEGFVFLVMGIIMLLTFVTSLRTVFSLIAFNVVTILFFLFMAFGNLFGIPSLLVTAGYCLIFSIITLLWTSCGITVNTAMGKNALPMGPPLIKPE